MTINEQRFNIVAKQAMDKYQQALEAKSNKNRIKHAEKTKELVEEAIKLAKIIGKKEKIPYLYEYTTLSDTFIGKIYFKQQMLVEAVEQFNIAREMNKKTLGNQETTIRDGYLIEHLLDIATMTQNWSSANNLAEELVDMCKKLLDKKEAAEYLLKAKTVFINTKNLNYVKKSYKILEKIVSDIDEKHLSLQAKIYEDCGEYYNIVIKKKKNAQKYYKSAVNAYEKLKDTKKVEMINKLLKDL